MEHLVHILVEVLVVTGISCSIDARSTSESIHFKSCIVCKTIASDLFIQIHSLLQRVGYQCLSRLRDIFQDTCLSEGNELKALT